MTSIDSDIQKVINDYFKLTSEIMEKIIDDIIETKISLKNIENIKNKISTEYDEMSDCDSECESE